MLLITTCRTYADTADPITETITLEAALKPDRAWRSRETKVLSHNIRLEPDAHNRFGGWTERKLADAGSFRTMREPSGRWWLVDPEGCAYLSIGMNAVRPNDTALGHDRMREIFNNKRQWAQSTAELLIDNGYNTLGAWSYWRSINQTTRPMPYTLQMNFAANYAKEIGLAQQGQGHRDYAQDLIPVFHPSFETFCRNAAASLGKHGHESMLLGVFSDNEMPFPHDALDRCLVLKKDDPSRVAAETWLNQQGASVQPGSINNLQREQFLKFMLSRYFKICHDAIGSQLPNALYLGCRFHGRALRQQAVFEAAGPYVDVISVNWYGRWTPQHALMDRWVQWSQRPFIITEFYAKGMDTGLPNHSGAGWSVQTQQDRGHFYQHFALSLLQHPGCVGWHWFRYIDNDPEDVLIDPTNIDSNKGIVDGQFKPYQTMLTSMRTLNLRVYALRNRLCLPNESARVDAVHDPQHQ